MRGLTTLAGVIDPGYRGEDDHCAQDALPVPLQQDFGGEGRHAADDVEGLIGHALQDPAGPVRGGYQFGGWVAGQVGWAGGEEDAAAIFSALGDTGIDYIHTTEYRALAPAFDGGSATLAALAKQHSGLTVIVNGQLDDPRDAAAVLESGSGDIVALAKPALANRNWPHLVRAGRTLAGDVPADLFGPVADIKDWELVTPDSGG